MPSIVWIIVLASMQATVAETALAPEKADEVERDRIVLCENRFEQVLAAAEVDQLLRRNWSPGIGNPPLGERLTLYTDNAAYHVSMAHDELVQQIIENCGDLIAPNAGYISSDVGVGIWLLMQHHHNQVWLAQNGMEVIDGLFSANVLSPQQYALFVDRVHWRTQGEQLYGSQGRCDEGVFVPFPIVDRDNVDNRRAEIGLGSIGQYTTRITENRCR
ncbi:DUF6624 domain-containing protein [Hyphobacterium sp.]|uniref:DUF6624 domain-containing protein n=1 Tax=Hyphobacterium sp. TaxID=2004662 RepID=UPI0037493637